MNNIDHAINYAEKGWAVLPLHTVINGRCTCGKEHCHCGTDILIPKTSIIGEEIGLQPKISKKGSTRSKRKAD